MKETKPQLSLSSLVAEIKNDISETLPPEIKNGVRRNNGRKTPNPILFDLMVDSVKTIVVDELKAELTNGSKDREDESSASSSGQQTQEARIEESLKKADKKLKERNVDLSSDEPYDDIEKIDLDDFDDVDLATIKKLEAKGVRIVYPNLKYRKPKYKDVESILKYNEDEDDKSGVKLVIMNFND